MPNITLPDGSIKRIPDGATVLDGHEHRAGIGTVVRAGRANDRGIHQ